MPANIVQQKNHVQNTATNSFVYTLDEPATAGNEIIIVTAADAYFNSGPVGFQEPAGARQERYLGHYVWHKTAEGGETSFTANPQVNCWGVWTIFEVSGLSGLGSLIASDGRSTVLGPSSTYTTPALTLTSGERFVLAALGGSYSAPITAISNWTNGFTEITDIRNTLASGTRDSLGVATYQGTFSEGQSIVTQANWEDGIRPESQTAIILAFNIGATDTTPPSTPTNLRVVSRTSSSISLSWSPSTDEVSVAGYQLQVNGVDGVKTASTSYTVHGLNENTSYQFSVRAYDTAENYSSYSSPVSIETLEGTGVYLWNGSSKVPANTKPVDPFTHYSLLERVPWDGGPSYYDSIPAMAGTEWTSDNFFPIGYWGAFVDQRDYLQRYKALGINTLWTTYANAPESSGWMREAGIWNLGGTLVDSGSEHVGHVVEDEVDMWAGSGWGEWTGATGFAPNVCVSGNGDCGYTVMQQTEAALPDDGKMRWTNYGLGVMTYLGDAASSAYVNGYTDSGSWPMHLVTGDMYFYSGGGSMVADAEIYFGRDGAAARRAGNYGELLMTRLRHLDGMHGSRKPLGVVVELGGQSEAGVDMTPDKVAGAVWSSIIHEARCISYFSHAFSDTPTNPWSSNVLWSSGGNYPQIQAKVGEISSHVTQLAPVLNTQSYSWSCSPDVSTMLKIKDGHAYIFAMAKVETNHSTAPRSMRLPFGITGKTAEVMFEGRTIPVRRGSITDSFVDETTHHIYRIAL